MSDAIEVQLFADELDELSPECYPMIGGERLIGSNGWVFTVHIQSTRPAEYFTPRVYPRHAERAIPLECPAIKWQR